MVVMRIECIHESKALGTVSAHNLSIWTSYYELLLMYLRLHKTIYFFKTVPSLESCSFRMLKLHCLKKKKKTLKWSTRFSESFLISQYTWDCELQLRGHLSPGLWLETCSSSIHLQGADVRSQVLDLFRFIREKSNLSVFLMTKFC